MPWSRRTWMTLAAASAALSALVSAVALTAGGDSRTADLVQAGAAVQFMHSMAALACATLMQIGGASARRAPAFFLGGIVLFSGALYALAAGAPPAVGGLAPAGLAALIAGWAVMIRAAREVDPAAAVVRQPSAGPRLAGQRSSPPR
jgi:uncharacterized membrane protein YgdD (TMEM256/DUF423 family)